MSEKTADQSKLFNQALAAFNIRFERDLTSRWEAVESATIPRLVAARPEHRENVLRSCFQDAAEEMKAAVHVYFPKLLGVAMATPHRLYVGDEKNGPASWVAAQIREQACTFLGMDEDFDESANPRDDSRVIEATHRILYCAGCLPDRASDEFLMPWWAHRVLLQSWQFSSPLRVLEDLPFKPPSGDEDECMSHADSLAWVREREVEIRSGLRDQIQNEFLDAMIESGRTGVSVFLQPAATEPEGDVGAQEDEEAGGIGNRFIRGGQFWRIRFGTETCKMQYSLGLDYLAVLLQNPGKPIRAMELQSEVTGQPPDKKFAELVVQELSEDDEGGELARPATQTEFTRQPVLDSKSRRQCEKTMRELEDKATAALNVGDRAKATILMEQHDAIYAILSRATGLWHRSRVFPDKNEKTRQSVTKAIKRAYEKIAVDAPETANHLKNSIETGSEFMYRDHSTPWIISRGH